MDSKVAELERRVAEASEQHRAISAILGVISGSPADVQPVLATVAERAAHLCDASFAQVLLVEGNLLRPTVAYWADVSGGRYDDSPGAKRTWPIARNFITGRAVVDGKSIHYADVVPLLDTEFPDSREKQRELGFRAILAVPLLREGGASGVILLFRPEPRPFSVEQIALVETFAQQAAIAIDNARSFGETKEALEQQTATSEILRVISSSPGDLRAMLHAVVERALKLCEAEDATIFLVEGDTLRAAARHRLATTPVQVGQCIPLTRGSVTGRAVVDRVAVHLTDLAVASEDEFPIGRELQRRLGHRAALSVPLLREDRAIGAIALWRMEARRFTDRQIALVSTFADQAVIAIENVRLFTQLEARTTELTRSVQELKALGEVGQAVSSTLDLETVLSTIASRATELTGMDGGAIQEYDEAHEEFHLRTASNLPDELVKALQAAPIPKSEGAVGRMASTREPVQFKDIAEGGSYQSRVHGILVRYGYRAVLAVPLLREDHLLGGLVVIRKIAGEFAPQVIDLLKTFATQSALAIQNARLYREIELKSRQLEIASHHKSEFLANMSHELRTPLNAIIGFSEVLSERMFGEINEKQAEYIGDILQSGQHLLSLINDILDLSKIEAGRMELELSDFDLPGTIENTLLLVRERAHRRGIDLGRVVDEHLGTIRADERKVKQVLLNLLSNALKFTPEGGRIEVKAAVQDGSVEISVADTGVGIAPEDQDKVFEEFRQVGTASKKVEGTGLGLAISRKFIELHGGRIWVRSMVGSGSTFSFTLPLR